MDQDKEPQSHRVITSDATMSQLGGALLGVIAKTAQRDVVLLTKSDIFGKHDPRSLKGVRTIHQNLRGLFNKAGIPDVADQDIYSIAEDALNNPAFANQADIDGDGKVDLGLIVLPDPDMTPQQAMSAMAGIPAHLFKDNLPGKGADYYRFIAVHEARHVSQGDGYESLPLLYEADSDKAGLDDASENGKEEVANALMEARGIAAVATASYVTLIRAMNSLDFRQMTESHDTSLFLDLDTKTMTEGERKAYLKSVLYVNTLAAYGVGGYMVKESLSHMHEGTGNGRAVLGPMELLDTVGDPLKFGEKAGEYMRENPLSMYVALTTLREKGYIQSGTAEAAYADKITGFFKKHIDFKAVEPKVMQSMEDFFSQMPRMEDLPGEFRPQGQENSGNTPAPQTVAPDSHFRP